MFLLKANTERIMFFMNAVTYLLLGLPCWKITSAEHNTCRTKRAISEYALKGHVISAIEGRTRESCVTSCEHFQNCFSINYYSTLKRCELNNKSAEWYKSDLVPTPGALYLTMVSRNYNPCVDRNPPCFGTCVPIPGSLATRCNCQGNVTCPNECKCDADHVTNFIYLSAPVSVRTAQGLEHRVEIFIRSQLSEGRLALTRGYILIRVSSSSFAQRHFLG